MDEFRALIKQKVERLFLVVWPPYGEERLSDVDVSIGFVFTDDPNQLCVVSTDKSDAWSPCIRYEPLPANVFAWSSFDTRIENWMNQFEGDIVLEYYEVTDVHVFENIVDHAVQSIEFVAAQIHDEPFGVKITFENDYILSTPISDGNTIETSRFNKNNNVSVYEYFGVIEYRPMKL